MNTIKHLFISNNKNCRVLMLMVILTLSACTTTQRSSPSSNYAPLICANAARYAGQTVGDGHCVSLIKRCSATSNGKRAPNTVDWRAGRSVIGNHLKPGSIIATFKNGRYPSKTGYHAAIYIEQTEQGIWVWDQWVGKPVHKRLIRFRKDRIAASNRAQAYRVVTIAK